MNNPATIQGRKARVEIVPLIDVVFFLLATFVLFTLSLTKIATIPLNLPEVGPPVNSEIVRVQVSGEGLVYWNGERVERADLPARLGHYAKNDRDPRVIVCGDRQADYGSAIYVIDEVRRAGIRKVSMQTFTTPTGM
jgi:biopolymer transport protein ExbD